MRYEFTKMQSLGNDFILLDGVSRKIKINAKIAKRFTDRHRGVGCDQILVAERPGGGADGEFLMRIFNYDGGEVGQCGNGARCFALFLRESGLAKGPRIRVRTCTTAMTLVINEDETVSVDMGVPEFCPEKIPFAVEHRVILDKDKEPAEPDVSPGALHTLYLDDSGKFSFQKIGGLVEIAAVAIGNPHAVQRVEDAGKAMAPERGALLDKHACFPEGVNAGFMQIAKRNRIHLRVYERGSYETLGCGSGACAAVAIGREWGELAARVRVSMLGGDVEVEWPGRGQPITLTGGAHFVFRGSIDL